MTRLAVTGGPPRPQPSLNVCEWIFSNQFSIDSELMKHVPPEEKHTIPKIQPTKPFIVDPALDAQITWGQTYTDALRIAAGLHNLGLRPAKARPIPEDAKIIPPLLSPVVMLHLPNCVPFPPILFGVFASGLTATLANPALTAHELAWYLQNSNPAVVITTAAGLKVVKDAIELVEGDDTRQTLRRSKLFVFDPRMGDYSSSHGQKIANCPGAEDWKTLLSSCPLAKPVDFSPEECRSRTAVILWSSGTTGKSKGVPLSHHSLPYGVTLMWLRYPCMGPDERMLGLAPWFHVLGMDFVLLVAAACGATMYVMAKLDFPLLLDYVSKYRLTFLHMSPPLAVMLAKSPLVEGVDMSSVRGAMSGGAALAPSVVDLVYKRLGIVIKLGYGLSEVGPVANQIGETYDVIRKQHACCGPPFHGVEIKIISMDGKGTTLRIEEEGEVLVRSRFRLNGYLNNEKATAESLDDDGWFHTGDIGKLDDRGYVWITDRLKEVIKVKGFQVAPSELEAILCSSDKVADAAVGPVYDEATATELPRAYIVPAEAALHQQCAPNQSPIDLTPFQDLGQHVRKLVESETVHYKWLRGNVVFVQQLPKSSAGKTLRRLLADVKGVPLHIYPLKQPLGTSKL